MTNWEKYFGEDAGKVQSSLSNFRSFVDRLGYKMTYEFSPEYKKFLIALYDLVDNKFICRMYSLEDLRCITHSSDIFWRYVK